MLVIKAILLLTALSFVYNGLFGLLVYILKKLLNILLSPALIFICEREQL